MNSEKAVDEITSVAALPIPPSVSAKDELKYKALAELKSKLATMSNEECAKFIYDPMWFDAVGESYCMTKEEGDALLTHLNELNTRMSGHSWFNHLRYAFKLKLAPRSFFAAWWYGPRYCLTCSINGILYPSVCEFIGAFHPAAMRVISKEQLELTLLYMFRKTFMEGTDVPAIVAKRRVKDDYDFFKECSIAVQTERMNQ